MSIVFSKKRSVNMLVQESEPVTKSKVEAGRKCKRKEQKKKKKCRKKGNRNEMSGEIRDDLHRMIDSENTSWSASK